MEAGGEKRVRGSIARPLGYGAETKRGTNMQREKLRRGLREITAKSTEKKEDRGREVGRVRSSQDL